MIELLKKQKNTCSYCGEAPVNHTIYFLDSLVSNIFDNYGVRIIKYVPRFIKDFVDFIPPFLFEKLSFLKLVKFSDDIEKARTFRSKIIWEEAKRRGINMEQIIFLNRPIDYYRFTYKIKNKNKRFYFESIPIRPEFLEMQKNWDDKIVLKKELRKHNIPVPNFFELSFLNLKSKEKIFSKLIKPIIVKPRVGSRARHTVTNINTVEHFKKGLVVVGKIAPYIVVEEHLDGFVCRATLVGGVLAGFYKGGVPKITGDGKKTIKQLIEDKNEQQIERYHVRINNELSDHIARFGFVLDDVLPGSISISLSHRAGQLFGGITREMLDELHPSFIPILEKATRVVGLSVVGFDCLIPDPTKDQSSQRWGIIECNTLPFIDMHYYALEGKSKNIAGMIWDMWN